MESKSSRPLGQSIGLVALLVVTSGILIFIASRF
jgi:hypothetical protein